MSNVNMVEICAIMNMPSHCMNRDEAGQPKESEFNGIPRAAVSSQSQKYAMRKAEAFDGLAENIGVSLRTRELFSEIVKECNVTDDDMILCIQRLCDELGKSTSKSNNIDYDKNTGTFDFSKVEADMKKEKRARSIPTGKKEDRKDQIMIITPVQKESLIAIFKKFIDACDGDAEKFAYFTNKNVFDLIDKKKKLYTVSLDTALFGSMTASELSSDVPASMHVARMISTNALVREDDYYSAMDDIVLEGTKQTAANLGYLPYNSSCMYKYGVIDLDIFKENLKGVENVDEVVKAIIPEIVRIFINTISKGKIASNANYVMPQSVIVTMKNKKVALNPVEAFALPVKPSMNTILAEESTKKLVEEIDCMDRMYNIEVEKRYVMNKYGIEGPKGSEMVSDENTLIEKIRSEL